MKKIISAVALTALVAGVATADVKFSLNYRTQMLGYSRLINAPNKNTYENHNYWFKNAQGYAAASDNVNVSASNEYAGVTVRIDPAFNSLTLNQYSAYIRLGSFELGAGVFKDGRYNGDFQLKNDSDNGNYGGETFAAYKLGTIYKASLTTEVDNLAGFAGTDNLATGYIQWKGEVAEIPITADFALIGLGSDTTYDKDNQVGSGFGLRLDAKFDLAEVQFVYKTASIKNQQSGVDVEPNEARAAALHFLLGDLVPNTKITVGGAAGWLKGDLTEANLDLRARYADGPLSVTFFTNISHITNEYYVAPKYGKHIGAYYYGDKEKITSPENTIGSHGSQKYDTAMWNLLGVRFKIDDTFTALFSAGDLISLSNITDDEWTGVEAFVAPGIQLFAGGKTSIVTYARFGWSHLGVKDYDKDGEGPEFAVIVPIIMRVRL